MGLRNKSRKSIRRIANSRTRDMWMRAVLRARDEEGQSILEFTFVVPMMLTLVLGVVIFGSALNNYLVLTDATAVGSRMLSISRGQTTDPCATTVQSIESAAPNLKAANLKFSFVLNGTAFSGTSCSGAQTSLVESQTAQVTVTYPCSLKFFGFNPAPSCILTAKTTERVQ